MGGTDGRHAGFRQAKVLDLAGFDQVLDRAGRILDRHIRIDAMLMVEIDCVDLQPLTI
jgi:hypothetical protein